MILYAILAFNMIHVWPRFVVRFREMDGHRGEDVSRSFHGGGRRLCSESQSRSHGHGAGLLGLGARTEAASPSRQLRACLEDASVALTDTG